MWRSRRRRAVVEEEASEVGTPALRQLFQMMTTIGVQGAIPKDLETDQFLLRVSPRNAASDSPTPYRAMSNGNTPLLTPRRRVRASRRNIVASLRNRTVRVVERLVVSPDGLQLFLWLGVLSIATYYNWWTAIVREAFEEIRDFNVWLPFDVLVDLVVATDVLVQFRTGYLEQGLLVTDSMALMKAYAKSVRFFIDVLSLFPLQGLASFLPIRSHPLFRATRLLKSYRVLDFHQKFEFRATYPNAVRVANLTHILILGAHWWACFYYMLTAPWADVEGSGRDGRAANMTLPSTYLLSVYWSVLTLTTIGNTASPRDDTEYFFSIVSYLIGVFIFATIDGAKTYMRSHDVGMGMQRRVQRWYDYSWSRGRMTGGSDIHSLSLLPNKLKAELAIQVNLKTLRKVSIFQECQPEFLHDLVLKMCAIIFTPGDVICRKGEIAREMYIIADGVLQVQASHSWFSHSEMNGRRPLAYPKELLREDGSVIRRLCSGDFFGEIGILNLDGEVNNRRTADVKSLGYSELFSLSRDDVLGAMEDHPEAAEILRNYGQQRLDICRLRQAKSSLTPSSPPSTSSEPKPRRQSSKRYHSLTPSSPPSTSSEPKPRRQSSKRKAKKAEDSIEAQPLIDSKPAPVLSPTKSEGQAKGQEDPNLPPALTHRSRVDSKSLCNLVERSEERPRSDSRSREDKRLYKTRADVDARPRADSSSRQRSASRSEPRVLELRRVGGNVTNLLGCRVLAPSVSLDRESIPQGSWNGPKSIRRGASVFPPIDAQEEIESLLHQAAQFSTAIDELAVEERV